MKKKLREGGREGEAEREREREASGIDIQGLEQAPKHLNIKHEILACNNQNEQMEAHINHYSA